MKIPTYEYKIEGDTPEAVALVAIDILQSNLIDVREHTMEDGDEIILQKFRDQFHKVRCILAWQKYCKETE